MALFGSSVEKIGLAAVLETSNFDKGMKDYMSGLGQMEGKTDSTASKLGSLGKTMGTALVGGAVTAAAAVGGLAIGLTKLAIDAAPLEGIGQAFDAMSEKAGLALDDLRTASKGMISDFELMKSANVALTGAGDELGQAFGKNLPRLLEIAQASAKATGQDVGFLFNSLVTGIKRTSPMLIDNTGLQLKLGEANQALADELGKTVEELTGEEKQIALLNATMAAGQTMVDQFGGGQLTAAERMAQFRAQLQNVKDSIGRAMLPALSALLKPIGELATKYGPMVTEWAEKAGEWLGENLPKAIQWLSDTWQQVWPQITNALETAWNVLKPIFDLISGWFTREGPSAFSRFRDTVGNVTGAIRGYIQDHFGWIVDWVKDNWPLVQETVSTVMEAIWSVVSKVLDAIRNFWEQNGETIMAVVKNVWTVITTIWETSLKTIFDVFKVVMQLITGDTEGAMETLSGIFDRFGQAAITIITALWDNIKLLWDKGVEAIKGAWEGLWDTLKGIGSNIIEGIKAGIEGAWESFKGWLQEKIDLLPDWLKSFMGVGSPAKIMIPLGAAIPEGLMAGVEQGMGKFKTQMEATINASMPSMNMPALTPSYAGAMSTTNTTHNHNLSVTANYSKPQSERSLRDDLRLNQSMMRMRTGSW